MDVIWCRIGDRLMLAQAIIASAYNTGTFVPWIPESGNTFTFTSDDPNHGYAGINFWWQSNITGGGAYIMSELSSPPPSWNSYTYPDASSGHTLDFDGTQHFFSPNLSQVGGTWGNVSITIDFWFYPTSNDMQLLSEYGEQSLSSGYHYTILEIDSSGYVHAHFWNGAPFVSTNQVVLNQWNHIWFVENTVGNHFFRLNDVETTGLSQYYRSGPVPYSAGNEYFAIGLSDATNMVTSNRFQGKIGNLTINDYAELSTFTATKAKYGL